MAKIKIKNSVTAGSAPSGLSFGEMAVNITDKKIFIGNAVEGVVTLHDQQNVVTSVNGRTGAVTGITASEILIGSSNVNGTRYLTFVGSSGSTGLFIDDVTTPLTYNPQQGNIGAKKATLTTSANIITLDSVTPNVVLTDGVNISTFGIDSFAASYSAGKFVVSNSIGITLSVGTIQGQGLGVESGSFSYELPIINGKAGQAVVWPSSGSGLTWSNVVTSVNGATGAVTNIAVTNTAQTFSGLQSFSTGISAATILAQTVGGDEGGQVDFGIPITNTSLTGGVCIDIYQDKMRFFEKGGSARGYYIDLSAGGAGAGTDLGGGGFSWSAVTADRSLVAEEGVLANKSSGTLTLTLPTTAALGKVIRVSGMQNTWRIAQNASQKINFGKTSTTVGTGGYLESSNARDAVELVCCVANTEWNVISSIGNITIV